MVHLRVLDAGFAGYKRFRSPTFSSPHAVYTGYHSAQASDGANECQQGP